MEDREPIPPGAGVVEYKDIWHVEGLALVGDLGTVHDDGDPINDQLVTDLKDGFVFVLVGRCIGNPDMPEQAQLVINIPAEGMMFMIAQAMSKVQAAPMMPQGMPPDPLATPSGIILPGTSPLPPMPPGFIG